MESLGDKLKTTREAKGYTYDFVGRETNIARRYLEALENEHFSKFPGEPYLLGFLRNYGEYLGLNVDELFSMYRAIKIQEQPVPVEQLLKSPHSLSRPVIALIAAAALLVLAGVSYLIFARIPAEPPQRNLIQLPMEYTLEGSFLERRFYKGDTILVNLGNEQCRIELRSLEDPLTLIIPGGSVKLNLSGDTGVDLNGDGIADMLVTLSDYDPRTPNAGALIRFDLNVNYVPEITLNPDLSPDQAAAQAGTVIFTSTNTYPFTMDIQFQSYCMFRWEVDRRERTERYFSRGDKLTIPVQNTIRLWSSNATAVTTELNGAGRNVTLNLGTAGEVVVIDLRWIRDNDGRFRLTQYRLE
ncbi:MAG: helix-turn-helix domain-containing protein [Treponema sp.]|nr:helix-turn-helix domain-containing protein [Treponema sp.]